MTALATLNQQTLDPDTVSETLGVVLKSKEDLDTVRGEKLASLLDRAMARA